MNIDGIIFDLDGTLWDSCRIVAESWGHTLRTKYGAQRVPTEAEVRSIMGMTVAQIAERLFSEYGECALEVCADCIHEENAYIAAHGGGKPYPGLAELLRRLCKIDGLVWVRVHYLYPDEMSQELIDVLANEPKIVKYLDIPIQHINDEILRKMNRRGNGEYVRQLFTKLRHEIPGLVLRTSLITGLPGEGEVEFAQLCDFLKEYKLERVGAFAFSPEEGTRAAEMEYPDTEIAKQRAEQVAEIQSRIMDDYNESCVGQVMQVLCEGYDPDEDSYYGRTYADSPDIDGKIWFTAEKHIKTGDFVDVHVVDTYDGELVGVLEEEYNDDCE